jgi:hypothetical protein
MDDYLFHLIPERQNIVVRRVPQKAPISFEIVVPRNVTHSDNIGPWDASARPFRQLSVPSPHAE